MLSTLLQYSYEYESYSTSSPLAILGGVMFMGFSFLIGIIIIISLWKTFKKAGKPGWASIIPIYNTVIMLEIIGKPVWWIILLIIPGINIIFGIWMLNLLSKSFGKSEGFTVGLLLLPFIFFPILGFGSAQYQGPSAAEAQKTI